MNSFFILHSLPPYHANNHIWQIVYMNNYNSITLCPSKKGALHGAPYLYSHVYFYY